MSGHSKWSKVKHQKEATDSFKGKIFTKLANAITLAVKLSSGNIDPNTNFKLRLAIEKARNFNMPKDKIEKSIERGSRKEEGVNIEEDVYEAFGPEGVGIIIEVATDNKQRTVSELKNILEKGGGVLAMRGAVSHFFQHVGLIHVPKNDNNFDKIIEAAISAGATDYEDTGESVEIYTSLADVHKVKELVEASGIPVSSFELYFKPISLIPISNNDSAQKVLRLLTNLEDIEDVQKVYANFDIPDEYLQNSAKTD